MSETIYVGYCGLLGMTVGKLLQTTQSKNKTNFTTHICSLEEYKLKARGGDCHITATWIHMEAKMF